MFFTKMVTRLPRGFRFSSFSIQPSIVTTPIFFVIVGADTNAVRTLLITNPQQVQNSMADIMRPNVDFAPTRISPAQKSVVEIAMIQPGSFLREKYIKIPSPKNTGTHRNHLSYSFSNGRARVDRRIFWHLQGFCWFTSSVLKSRERGVLSYKSISSFYLWTAAIHHVLLHLDLVCHGTRRLLRLAAVQVLQTNASASSGRVLP